jgi:hypothetical protein
MSPARTGGVYLQGTIAFRLDEGVDDDRKYCRYVF